MGCGDSSDPAPPIRQHKSKSSLERIEQRLEHSFDRGSYESTSSFDTLDAADIENVSIQFYSIGDTSPPDISNEDDWEIANLISIQKGIVKVKKHVLIGEIDLRGTPVIKLDHAGDYFIVTLEKPGETHYIQ
jgi:hypothetical protein